VTSLTGVILAGGQGSRMGGVDKGLQPFRGKAMVEHVVERFGHQGLHRHPALGRQHCQLGR